MRLKNDRGYRKQCSEKTDEERILKNGKCRMLKMEKMEKSNVNFIYLNTQSRLQLLQVLLEYN